jgi:hypothetical protein
MDAAFNELGAGLDLAKASTDRMRLALLCARFATATGELTAEQMGEIVDLAEDLVLGMLIQLMSMGLSLTGCPEIFVKLDGWSKHGC